MSDIDDSLAWVQEQLWAAQRRSAELGEQIARLQEAKRVVDGLVAENAGLYNWVSAYDVGEGWQGNRREDFEEKRADATTSAQSYANAVSTIDTQIANKISDLSMRRLDYFGIIEGYQQRLSSFWNGFSV
ncbi:MAG: DUF5082 family protein [Acidobacteriota bacterium]|nr:DUF5082 family protein [Acidobacteriota bacterium]